MLKCRVYPQTFKFSFAAATSKSDLIDRKSWFPVISDGDNFGIGECAPMPNFSIDWRDDFEDKLFSTCAAIQSLDYADLSEEYIYQNLGLEQFPSIVFGFETAIKDLKNGGDRVIFRNSFVDQQRPIPINGLIWMSEVETMWQEINQKINLGFRCIKIKVGSRKVSFDEELSLLKKIRQNWGSDEITIRLDANGAFSSLEAQSKLEQLARFDIDSIEQPLKVRDPYIVELCKISPISIVLDEELTTFEAMRVDNPELDRRAFLQAISPQAIVIKPSLHGGLKASIEWIRAAEACNISWWLTSFLESNIGLNAIAQLATEYSDPLKIHGLGTGQIFSNNISSPLKVESASLHYNKNLQWDLSSINFNPNSSIE